MPISDQVRPLVFLALALVVSAPVLGQWSETDRQTMAARFDNAASNLDEDRFPSPNASKRKFLRDLSATESFLSTNTSKSNFRRWMNYLDVQRLREALGSPDAIGNSRTARTIGREAVELRYRLIGNTPGLELPVMTQLRTSTENLIDAIRFRDSDRSGSLIAKQLEAVADDVRSMESNPTADDVANLNQMIALLQSSGQAAGLVSGLKSRFRSPNIKVSVSEQIVQSAINRSINQSQPVRDCILGTRMVGTATLGGSVTANVLPSVGSARVEVMMNGQVSSRNVGYNGPVKVHTVSQGQVNVRRALYINEAGIAAEPAIATASLNSQIVSIDHKLRLVRKIARRKANEQKPQAERLATERLRQQVGSEFSQQTDEATSVSMPDPMAKLRPMLDRFNLTEPTRLIGSTDTDIYVEATLARDDQLAAPSLPLAPSNRPSIGTYYDVALQLHETVIDNAISPVLAGRTMTETQLNQLMQPTPSAKSKSTLIDEESNVQDDEPPFEIDFARVRPIVFEARDQTIKLGIRGTRFAQGKRELKRAIEITAIYVPAMMPDGSAMLIRTGDVEVDFTTRNRKLSVTQTGLKTTIEKKFANVFPETLLHRSFQVPPTVKLEAIAGQSFRPQTIDAQDGWITITVTR